ncbi:hypothetical protein B484DRAFT_479248 [Ochromonadaceae sp. CCMP2298]|nr:hypothetical protein B484DRAFT_479248 [Ochromonadaceae sp. CCMP2298]
MPRPCSYCYTPLDKILCCSRCSKHPYCSRECQTKDWKKHKLWCGCTAELDVDFEVRDAGEGRGLGIFALRAFEIGEKILVERCVLQVPEYLDGKQKLQEVARRFASLPASIQTAVIALHQGAADTAGSFLVSLFGEGVLQFKYNAFGLESEGSGIFVTASRLNHSCLANCGRYYLKCQKLMVISAEQHIPEGEELIITYTTCGAQSYDAHCAFIQDTWKFTCTCRACEDPALAQKLVRIEQLDAELMWLGSSSRQQEAYEAGESMIALYDELGLGASRRRRTWYDMFQMAVTREAGLDKAKYCVQQALDNWVLSVGGSNPEAAEVAKMRSLRDKPQGHGSYLLLRGSPW